MEQTETGLGWKTRAHRRLRPRAQNATRPRRIASHAFDDAGSEVATHAVSDACANAANESSLGVPLRSDATSLMAGPWISVARRAVTVPTAQRHTNAGRITWRATDKADRGMDCARLARPTVHRRSPTSSGATNRQTPVPEAAQRGPRASMGAAWSGVSVGRRTDKRVVFRPTVVVRRPCALPSTFLPVCGGFARPLVPRRRRARTLTQAEGAYRPPSRRRSAEPRARRAAPGARRAGCRRTAPGAP
jgi:hypothetical protein